MAKPDEGPMLSPFAALSDPYPTSGLIAKDETQVSSFLKRFPDYDGRGIRVAVLDSGIDPATFGLDGKNKIVDIIDCTGTCEAHG
jgi:tripeptidyl-peptidase-2